jgi:predicted regulator of Ras-like GTPase activity (Roadblock/LC7/MglB family)
MPVSSFPHRENQNLLALLSQLDSQPGVLGSLLVGYDGKLIAQNMKKGDDAEPLGTMALTIYLDTVTAMQKLGQKSVHQIVSKTSRGHIVIANFGNGLLVTLSNNLSRDGLIMLMRSITTLVATTAE